MGTIPSLADCKPGIKPTSFCVLVAIAEQEEKTQGGIILIDSHKDKERIVEQRGRLVDVSPAAFDFAEWPASSRPQVGNAIIFGKLAGVQIDGEDGRKYRLLNDKDVLAIVEEAA